MKILTLLLTFSLGLTAAPLCLNTTSCVFQINEAAPSTGLPQYGSYGTVSASLVGQDILFTVDLLDSPQFLRLIDIPPRVDFGFNKNDFLGSVGDLSLVSAFPEWGYGVTNTAFSNSFGSFDAGIPAACFNSSGCGPNVATFVFSRVGGFTDVNQLIRANANGAIFSLDVSVVTCAGNVSIQCITDKSVNGLLAVTQVPEPGTFALVGFGLLVLSLAKRIW